ncbi:hypothetical protein EZV73_02870 [Acidaminobacter sp. JC074]|uniref:hypothetical protein n=1 Tax=Acidaminobacter sp. JC074 TaxID=2530199 RepID=UPI001F11907B|nr:hypothetical protein [Acidaminobacter sp. JC074]MCH4886490.1 hypothetical protein [Acidaminobacter sp. JC074]
MKTKDITTISFGVASIIAGGFIVLAVSKLMPFPGIKFILMAPFLSMMMYVLSMKIENKYAILYIGLVFAGIMSLFHVVMGLSIVTTTLLTQVSIIGFIDKDKRSMLGGIFFSMYTGLTALIFSKHLIGGIFENVTFIWIGITVIICAGFGLVGGIFGKRILKHLNSIISR